MNSQRASPSQVLTTTNVLPATNASDILCKQGGRASGTVPTAQLRSDQKLESDPPESKNPQKHKKEQAVQSLTSAVVTYRSANILFCLCCRTNAV